MPTSEERDNMSVEERTKWEREVERIGNALRIGKEQEENAKRGDPKHPTGVATNQAEIEGIKSVCDHLRHFLGQIANDILALKFHPNMEEDKGDRSEMIANIMLSYRHLEDARMRLGKVIQAYEGGVSIFDKPKQEAV